MTPRNDSLNRLFGIEGKCVVVIVVVAGKDSTRGIVLDGFLLS